MPHHKAEKDDGIRVDKESANRVVQTIMNM